MERQSPLDFRRDTGGQQTDQQTDQLPERPTAQETPQKTPRRTPQKEAQNETQDDGPNDGQKILHNDETGSESAGVVVPLNQAGAVFDALATEIRGSAAGWPTQVLEQLEAALLERYGPLIGGKTAVQRLVLLATEEPAA